MKVKFTPRSFDTIPPGQKPGPVPKSKFRWCTILLIFLLLLNLIALPFFFLTERKASPHGRKISKPKSRLPEFFMGHSYHSDTLKDTVDLAEHLHLYNDDVRLNEGLYGIDVSKWQDYINWEMVRLDTAPRRIDFAIIKSTQGAYGVDADFASNWENAVKNIKISGAYHFYMYGDDPVLQAENFIRHTPLEKGDFLPIIDIELACRSCTSVGGGKEELLRGLRVFLAEIERHFKAKPILYSYTYFKNEYLNDGFDDYPFWVAQYAAAPPPGFSVSGLTGISSNVLMWQFTSRGRINGITGHVDMSFTHGYELNRLLLN